VSAEIFVVCEGFLAPKKIDPRLLDSRWVFKEIVDTTKKTVDIFKNKSKRNRSGYDTDSILLHKKCSVLKLIEADSPAEILGQYNQIVFEQVEEGENEELIKQLEKNPLTTEEIKNCLSDLKVLNARDFRGILKWITKLKKLMNNKEESENVVEENELDNLTQK